MDEPYRRPTREEIIARLAEKFGPHMAVVSRKPDEDHRHPWTEFVPSGNDERGSTLITFRDADGCNSIRPLTYGEIADALTEKPDIPAQTVPDEMAAELAQIRTVLDGSNDGEWYGAGRRLLAAVEAALKHHQREPLYGSASTEEEPGNCPHDPDDTRHFEADDGSGEWLCEDKPEGAVCSTCTEDDLPVDWPCPEYAAVLAALTGKEAGRA